MFSHIYEQTLEFIDRLYLVGKTDLEMDKSIRDKSLTIQKLPDDERKHIVFTLDALLRDAKTRSAYGINH